MDRPDIPDLDLDIDRREFRILLVVGFVVGLLAAPVIAAHLSGTVAVSGGVPVSAPDGMTVTLEGSTDANLEDFTEGTDTVALTTESGNITFQSAGSASANVHESNITGTWTTVTGIDAGSNDVTIDPGDKQQVTVGKSITKIRWKSAGGVGVDDGSADFVYAGPDGTTSKVAIGGLPAGTTVAAVDADTRELLDVADTNANGRVTFSNLENSEHTVEIVTGDSEPSLSNPQPEGQQSDYPTTLSIDVDDGDFPDDNVTVDFFLDGTKVGSDTVTDTGTASTSISEPSPGGHDVKVEAEDSFGNTNNRSWTFATPDNLTVRDANDPWDPIGDRQVNVTFYQDDTVVERSTTDANISLEGLDTDSQIVVEGEADGYNDSFVVIEDITKQNTIYMVNDTVDTVDVRFTLNDQTGGLFSNNEPYLLIQKPINRTGTPNWKTVHGADFGVEGVTTEIEQGQRYRLIVKNNQGDQRLLGSYDAETSETRELTVGAIPGELEDPDEDFAYDADFLNTSSGKYVRFTFNDTTNATDELTVKIHERGNESNVLFANTTFGGPLGSVGITERVPAAQNETDWVVKAWVKKDGEVTTLSIPVGPQRPLLNGMPDWLKLMISIGSIWIVAGLFSQLNGDVGALVVAGLGAMFWFVDFLPPDTGFGVVLLSMITAAVIFINERRGGGL